MALSQRARGDRARRRNLRRRRARAALLEAARELAHERGYRRLRAGEIARRAGLSRETFYAYFPDKQACVAEACSPALGEIDSLLRLRVFEGERWAERLLRGVAETLEEIYLVADEPRARTMDAVLRLAAERGYENVGLKELLRDAHMNKSELTRSFGSIEGCFRAAFARLVDRIEREVMAGECERARSAERDGARTRRAQHASGNPDPRERLGALLRLLAERPAEARVLALEAAKLPSAEGEEATRGGARALEGLIERLLFIDRDVPPEPVQMSMAAGAVAHVIRADVSTGRFEALPGRLGQLEAVLAMALAGGAGAPDRGETHTAAAHPRPLPVSRRADSSAA